MDYDFKAYGVLAGSSVVANSGSSRCVGDFGSSATLSGSGTLAITGQTNVGTVVTNASSFYSAMMALTPGISSSVSNIGGATFTPGIIQLTSAAVTIGGSGTNVVTLNGAGTYLFQLVNSGITTTVAASSVSINLTNGAMASKVFWAMNGSVNFQSSGSFITAFVGSIISQGNITLGTGSSSAGSLIAPNSSGSGGGVSVGTITLNGNIVVSGHQQIFLDKVTFNYIIEATTLADSRAIQLNALDTTGGISMTAGTGGIMMSPTNGTITFGNQSSLTSVVARYGPSGIRVDSQYTDINLGTTSVTVTMAQLQTKILKITPTTAVNVTLPTSALVVAAVSSLTQPNGVMAGDAFDFVIVNLSTTTNAAGVTMVVGSGGGGGSTSSIGNMVVQATANSSGTILGSGSGMFRIMITVTTSGSESYIVYRIA
jgi:hypothetical protein